MIRSAAASRRIATMFRKKTPSFTSYSQAGQDVFAYFVCGAGRGSFLDIGASNPVAFNNTYGLERAGWHGIAVDNCADYATQYAGVRTTPLTVLDMTKVDWNAFIAADSILQDVVDYMSFDIDEASLPVLRKFPFDRLRFRAMTVEHDAYRTGNSMRCEMRSILQGAGYELIAADVVVYYLWRESPEAMALNGYLPFEDWYVMPGAVDMAIAAKFRSSNKLWSDILETGLHRNRNVWRPR
jgi:hypothetical protein